MNTEATQDHQEANSTGARLRNAREQLGLSQQAVAERLCLKVSTVRDIGIHALNEIFQVEIDIINAR